MQLVFATANEHKIKEVQSLPSADFALLGLREAGISEDIPETADTLEGNALQKARYVFRRTGMPCFADDTGLEIKALGGMPGVHTARYAGEGKDPQANMDKVLRELSGAEDRSARFRTVIAYIDPKGGEHLFEGEVAGRIAGRKSGAEGFGYDPIFVPEGFSETFAEIPLEKKNEISHRGRAMAKFLAFLKGGANK